MKKEQSSDGCDGRTAAEKKSGGFKKGIAVGFGAAFVFMLAVMALWKVGMAGRKLPEGQQPVTEETPGEDQSVPEETSGEEQSVPEEMPSVRNVLRAAEVDEIVKANENPRKSYMLGTDIIRGDIISITFLDTLEKMPEEHWDVSADGNGSVAAWAEKNGDGYDFYIAGDGGVTGNPDCTALFIDCKNLREIHFNGCFDTSQVKSMYGMFNQCRNLAALDVSGWDTSQVTDMGNMFYECNGLTKLNMDGLDTSQVTDMSGMFYWCTSLAELNINGFDTSQVTDMSGMFYWCGSLTALDIGGFNTSQVTDMYSMFAGCVNLRVLDVSGFDTSQVINMNFMFKDCSCLLELDISGFDMSGVEDDTGMLSGTRWE